MGFSSQLLCDTERYVVEDRQTEVLHRFFMGIESISPTRLKGARKYYDMAQKYREGIRCLHEHGLSMMARTVVGFDGDTRGIFEKTLEFIEGMELDAAYFKIPAPCAGTNFFTELRQAGQILTYGWSEHLSHKHVVYRPALMEAEVPQRPTDDKTSTGDQPESGKDITVSGQHYNTSVVLCFLHSGERLTARHRLT